MSSSNYREALDSIMTEFNRQRGALNTKKTTLEGKIQTAETVIATLRGQYREAQTAEAEAEILEEINVKNEEIRTCKAIIEQLDSEGLYVSDQLTAALANVKTEFGALLDTWAAAAESQKEALSDAIDSIKAARAAANENRDKLENYMVDFLNDIRAINKQMSDYHFTMSALESVKLNGTPCSQLLGTGNGNDIANIQGTASFMTNLESIIQELESRVNNI